MATSHKEGMRKLARPGKEKENKEKIEISLITTIYVCRSLALSRLKTGKFIENQFLEESVQARRI